MSDLPGIFLLRGKNAGDKPADGRLRPGEIGINEYDKKLFLHDPASDTPFEFSLNGGSGAVSRRILAYDGYDMGAAADGSSFVVELADEQIVTLHDIAALSEGWSVDLFFNGRPSGVQTSFIQFAAGAGQFEFRGVLSDKFYILGGGEGFRLIKRGNFLVTYCIKQPAPVKIHKNKTNEAVYLFAGVSAWTAMSLDAGSHVNFENVAGGVRVPVAGQYIVHSRILAKWIVSGGDGYLKTKVGSETELDRAINSADSYKYLKNNLTANLEAGDVIKSEIYLTPSAQFYANHNLLTVEFSGR